jgi:Ca2+-binding EF-hand superfamily protein
MALVNLGLNILDQEVIDMTNTVAKNGLVFFPEFCKVVLRKFREDDEEQVMLKVRQ